MRTDFNVRIVRCSLSGAWWRHFVGQVIHVFAVDQYGYWTRDTGDMHLSQWIVPTDTEEIPGSAPAKYDKVGAPFDEPL